MRIIDISCDGETFIYKFRTAAHDPEPNGFERLVDFHRVGQRYYVRIDFDDDTEERTISRIDTINNADGEVLLLHQSDIKKIDALLEDYDAVNESGSFVRLIERLHEFMVARSEKAEFEFVGLW